MSDPLRVQLSGPLSVFAAGYLEELLGRGYRPGDRSRAVAADGVRVSRPTRGPISTALVAARVAKACVERGAARAVARCSPPFDAQLAHAPVGAHVGRLVGSDRPNDRGEDEDRERPGDDPRRRQEDVAGSARLDRLVVGRLLWNRHREVWRAEHSIGRAPDLVLGDGSPSLRRACSATFRHRGRRWLRRCRTRSPRVPARAAPTPTP